MRFGRDELSRAAEWVLSLKSSAGPRFHMGPALSVSDFGTCFGVLVLHQCGVLDDVPRKLRDELLQHISSLQDPGSGLFYSPLIEDHRELAQNTYNTRQYLTWQLTAFAISALSALESLPRHPLVFCRELGSTESIDAWLSSLLWDKPGQPGNMAMFAMAALLTEYVSRRESWALDAANYVLDWHDEHVNARGTWGVGGRKWLFEDVMGAFHQHLFYRYLGKPFTKLSEAAELTMRYQWSDGHYSDSGYAGGCEDMDACMIISFAAEERPDSSEAALESLGHACAAICLLQHASGGFCWRSARRKLYSQWAEALERCVIRPPASRSLATKAIVFEELRMLDSNALGRLVRSVFPARLTQRGHFFKGGRHTLGWVDEIMRWGTPDLFSTFTRLDALANISIARPDLFPEATPLFLPAPGLGSHRPLDDWGAVL